MTARCGYVALIGAPNAGKSTLLNTLVGTKVAIVSHKVQTTRAKLLGIGMEGETQIVYIDTPGIFAPKRRLDRAMVHAAWTGAEEADFVVLLIDSQKGMTEEAEAIIERLKKAGRKAILALNKVDAVEKPKLLKLAQQLHDTGVFTDVFMVSALTGSGVNELKSFLAARMPEGIWLYDEDQASTVPLRVLAAEITREKIYHRLHQELPYETTVETESWEEQKDGSVRISQVIFVARDSQKGIVIGKGGQTLKTIGALAREELEAILECRVHLFLFVKVAEKWAESREHYRNIGLDYPD